MRLAAALLGSAAYLALAVLGWGSPADFFSHPPFVALALATAGMAVAAAFSSGNLSAGVREARSGRWVIGVFGVLGLLLAYVPAYLDRRDFAALDGEAVRWLGVALFAAGGVLRIRPVFALGHRFSGLVSIQPGHTLVTGGIYAHIRHPSYLGLLIQSLGWALAFRSAFGVLLVALLLIPLAARIRSEEALLQEQFGADYAAYRARTSRMIPGLY